MIEIKDGRIWFYDAAIESTLPVLDYELISAYICPACKSIISAYFVGNGISKDLLSGYNPGSDTHVYDIGSVKEGGSYITQKNHGKDTHRGKNCTYQTVTQCRGIENAVKGLTNLGSLSHTQMLDHFVKLIEEDALKDKGIMKIEDICGVDNPILLLDLDTIAPHHNLYGYDDELAEKLKELIAKLYTEGVVEQFDATKFVELDKIKLGGNKTIRLAKNQTSLF